MGIGFVQRREWFEEYAGRVERGVATPPPCGVRQPCPCCGYPTLDERGIYDICKLCDWEDDGSDDPQAELVQDGPNYGYSLAEARVHFERHRIMYDPYDPDKPAYCMGGNTNTALERQAKDAIVRAFDDMVKEPAPATIDALWRDVLAHEAILSSETLRRVRAYEARTGGEDPEPR